jgi:hypothetical protein
MPVETIRASLSGILNFRLVVRANPERSQFPVREEGQVELSGEAPNRLDADAIVPVQRDSVNADFYEIERR